MGRILSAWSVKLPITLLHEGQDGGMMSSGRLSGKERNNICSVCLLQYYPSAAGYQPEEAGPHPETPQNQTQSRLFRSSAVGNNPTRVCVLTTHLSMVHLDSGEAGNGSTAVGSNGLQQQHHRAVKKNPAGFWTQISHMIVSVASCDGINDDKESDRRTLEFSKQRRRLRAPAHLTPLFCIWLINELQTRSCRLFVAASLRPKHVTQLFTINLA